MNRQGEVLYINQCLYMVSVHFKYCKMQVEIFRCLEFQSQTFLFTFIHIYLGYTWVRLGREGGGKRGGEQDLETRRGRIHALGPATAVPFVEGYGRLVQPGTGGQKA